MKTSIIVPLFIVANITFIFLHIHKRSLIISQSFQTQKNEQLANQMRQKTIELSQQLLALQNRTSIKQYAQETLQMEPLKISTIKKLTPHE